MKTRHKHPSYGMISIARVNSNGTILFGSRIKHNDFIKLEICSAERERNEYSEHFFPKKTLVSVFLSSAQFSHMLTKSNTPGVPCTIEYTREDGHIDREKFLKSLRVELEEDTNEAFEKLKKRSHKLADIIQNEFKGPINKTKREEIKDLVIQIENDINSNLEFLLTQQIEKLEEVGAEIVSEAEARISSLVHEAGVKSLQNQKLIRRKNVE